MTISSSLNASVAGLAANASRLATISDNISNSSTYGYKRAVTDFQSMVIESGQGTYSAGGVRTTTSRLIDERGSLVSTSNPTDMAVRGRGMLPVTSESSVAVGNGENPLFLTTTGSFRPDALGFLRTPGGLVLMGVPAAADGTIPNYPRDSIDGLVPVQINANQDARYWHVPSHSPVHRPHAKPRSAPERVPACGSIRPDRPRSAPRFQARPQTCHAMTSPQGPRQHQAKAVPGRAPQTATCAASPRKSLPLATTSEWPCCSAEASASARPPYVPVNIPNHRPIPPS